MSFSSGSQHHAKIILLKQKPLCTMKLLCYGGLPSKSTMEAVWIEHKLKNAMHSLTMT